MKMPDKPGGDPAALATAKKNAAEAAVKKAKADAKQRAKGKVV